MTTPYTIEEAADELIEALREARETLTKYACHGGALAPCLRSMDQCASECGKPAGDTIVRIDTLLARYEGEAK